MKRYERVEGSCNEQAEGTDADAVFNLLPGSTIRNVIIGQHQSEGIHALGDAWVENGKTNSRTKVLESSTSAFRTQQKPKSKTKSAFNSLSSIQNTNSPSLVGRRLRRRPHLQRPQHPTPRHRRRRPQRPRQNLPRQLPRRKIQHHRLRSRHIRHILPVVWKLPQPGKTQRYDSERYCYEWY